MLRKVIWFVIILFVGYVWFSFLLKSCNNVPNGTSISQITDDIGEDEDVVFQADEDSGDDGYIISDDTKEEVIADVTEKAENIKEKVVDKVTEIKDDFVEKSPEPKRKISREAISETSYTDDNSIGYYVITGSFSDEVNADRMVEKLNDMGYMDAEKIVFDFSQYYSVVSGKYDTESSARSKSLELKNKNINAYVHKMRSKLFGE